MRSRAGQSRDFEEGAENGAALIRSEELRRGPAGAATFETAAQPTESGLHRRKNAVSAATLAGGERHGSGSRFADRARCPFGSAPRPGATHERVGRQPPRLRYCDPRRNGPRRGWPRKRRFEVARPLGATADSPFPMKPGARPLTSAARAAFSVAELEAFIGESM